MHKYMGSNFPSALLTLGGVGLAVHYEQLCNLFDGVPLIMAWGKPVSGKTTAVRAAMALIGQEEAVGGMFTNLLLCNSQSKEGTGTKFLKFIQYEIKVGLVWGNCNKITKNVWLDGHF